MLSFDCAEAPRVEQKIDLPGGSFVLFLSPPSLAQRLEDESFMLSMIRSTCPDISAAAYRSRFTRRLERVAGWDQIVDSSGKQLPFTLQALHQLIGRFPSIMDQLQEPFRKLFSTDEAAVGKPVASQNDSQTAEGSK